MDKTRFMAMIHRVRVVVQDFAEEVESGKMDNCRTSTVSDLQEYTNKVKALSDQLCELTDIVARKRGLDNAQQVSEIVQHLNDLSSDCEKSTQSCKITSQNSSRYVPKDSCTNTKQKYDSEDAKSEESTLIDKTDRYGYTAYSMGDEPNCSSSDAMKQYIYYFRHLPDKLGQVKEVYDCACLISEWFEKRYSVHNAPAVGFDMKKFYTYAQWIIMAYGENIEKGTVDNFVQEFRDWMDDLTPENPFPVPTFVGKYKNLSSRIINYISVGIEKVFKTCDCWKKLSQGINLGSHIISKSDIYTKFNEFLVDSECDYLYKDNMRTLRQSTRQQVISRCGFHERRYESA